MQVENQTPIANWYQHLQCQDFTWSIFQFHLKTTEHSYLPRYKGSTIRGGFGHSFRRVCCTVRDVECGNCMLNKTCPYAYVFETPKVNGMELKHQASNLPHPFVIEPPETEQTEFNPGDELTMGLALFGKSISFLPYFVYAIDQMGRLGLGKGRGRFELTMISAFDDLSGQSRTPVYDNQSQVLNGNFKIWKLADILTTNPATNSETIRLKFITPTRILQKNRLVDTISYELLMRNLLRRISLLGKIHCESSWDLPFSEIIELANQNVRLVDHKTTWYDWERYSNRQKRRMNMGGIIGSISYQGNLAPFMALVILGQFTHIGKNTTFGLGKYFLEYGE